MGWGGVSVAGDLNGVRPATSGRCQPPRLASPPALRPSTAPIPTSAWSLGPPSLPPPLPPRARAQVRELRGEVERALAAKLADPGVDLRSGRAGRATQAMHHLLAADGF